MRVVAAAALFAAATLVVAAAACKKKKPPAEAPVAAAEREGEPGRPGPRRAAQPRSVGTPARDTAARDQAGQAAGGEAEAAGTATRVAGETAPDETAAGEWAGGNATSGERPPGAAIPASGAREAAAKAPPELGQRGHVEIGTPEVDGDRAAEELLAVIRGARSLIVHCHTQALQETPNLAGATTFDLTIDTRGVVVSWTAGGSLNAKLTECVANRLRGLRFGAADAEARVRVPVTFGR